jgi:flagellar motor switch protein FliG
MAQDKKQQQPLSGAQKAAVFLMSMGEDAAADIMRHLGPKEVQLVGQAMSTLNNINRDQVNSVMDDFITAIGQQTALGIGNTDYIRAVLSRPWVTTRPATSSTAS